MEERNVTTDSVIEYTCSMAGGVYWMKECGLPIAELFGGRFRDRIPAYASAMSYLEGGQG